MRKNYISWKAVFGVFVFLLLVFGISVVAGKAFAVTDTVYRVTVNYTNDGDANTTVYTDILGGGNIHLAGQYPVIVGGTAGSATRVTRVFDIYDYSGTEIYVRWDPYKNYNEDPDRDRDCRDPITPAAYDRGYIDQVGQRIYSYEVNISFACWIPGSSPPPPPPPPPPDIPQPPLSSMGASNRCDLGNVALPDVRFSWSGVTGATYYRVFIWDPDNLVTNEAGRVSGWSYSSATANSYFQWNDLPQRWSFTWSVGSYNSVYFSGVAYWKTHTDNDCRPDLVVTSITTNKSTYTPGETVSVSMTVKNQGASAAGVFNTIYRVANFTSCTPEGAQQNFPLASLAAGASYTFNGSFPILATASPGTYTINSMADVYCKINEQNEGNNRNYRQYTVISRGVLQGRVWKDDDRDGKWDSTTLGDATTELYIQNGGTACGSAYQLAGVSVTYTGPQGVTIYPNACNSGPPTLPYYSSGLVNTGNYTVKVNPPAGWTVTGVIKEASWTTNASFSVTGNLTLNDYVDTHWGIAPAIFGNPSGLSVTPSCNALTSNIEVRFQADLPSGVTGSWIDVNTAQWIDAANPVPWSTKTTNSTNRKLDWTWKVGAPMDGGPLLLPQPNTPYYWRVKAFKVGDESDHVYKGVGGVTTTPSLGVSFTTPDCPVFDLSASFVPGQKNVYKAGEIATLKITVANVSPPANTSSPPTVIGFWPQGETDTYSLPNCGSGQAATVPPGVTYSPSGGNIGTITQGSTLTGDVTVSFNVGTEANDFTAYAYAIPGCNQADVDWTNNISSTGFTYRVQVDSWFETTGGDVGAKGSISVAQDPPSGRFQSGYLLVGNSLASNVISQKWRITGYDKQLMVAPPYAYMEDRFKQGAVTTGPGTCNNVIPYSAGSINYCNGDFAYTGGVVPLGNPVIFIDGNLTIGSDLVVASSNTITFIVSRDVTVATTVKKADGVYIVGETFHDTTDDLDTSGNQLEVNGAIYAHNLSLLRKLGATATCNYSDPRSCTNLTDPADLIKYDPKYLIALNDLLGSPGVAWKEVAP